MKRVFKKIWKIIKKFPLSNYVILSFAINLIHSLFEIKFWYDTTYGIARFLIFLPIIFIYAEMDGVLFEKADQNNYHIKTDLVVVVLFILLDLLLLYLRKHLIPIICAKLNQNQSQKSEPESRTKTSVIFKPETQSQK
jgi:hypothetical protein